MQKNIVLSLFSALLGLVMALAWPILAQSQISSPVSPIRGTSKSLQQPQVKPGLQQTFPLEAQPQPLLDDPTGSPFILAPVTDEPGAQQPHLAGHIASVQHMAGALRGGETVVLSVTVQNTGPQTWDPRDIALEVYLIDGVSMPVAYQQVNDLVKAEPVYQDTQGILLVLVEIPQDHTGELRYEMILTVGDAQLDYYSHEELLNIEPYDPLLATTQMPIEPALRGGSGQAVDLVFAMDTSGSMFDEFTALCTKMDEVIVALGLRGLTVRHKILGITSNYACTDGTVTAIVPGGLSNHEEDWGPATYDLSVGYPWAPGYIRLIVPMSDEGPEDGDSCYDPGTDRDSITTAIAGAVANNVRVAPVIGSGANACTERLAQDLADGTGGKMFYSTVPGDDLVEGLLEIVGGVIAQSWVEASKSAAGLGETLQVTVTLLDEGTTPVPNHTVRLISERGPLDTFGASTGKTNANGQYVTTLQSLTPGLTRITAKDLTDNNHVLRPAWVSFGNISAGPPSNDPLGAPVIQQIKGNSKLEGIYATNLLGMSETIEVIVDWQEGTPGTVEFSLNGKVTSVTATGPIIRFPLQYKNLKQGENILEFSASNAEGTAKQTRMIRGYAAPDWIRNPHNVVLMGEYVELSLKIPGVNNQAWDWLFSSKPTEFSISIEGKIKLPLRGGDWELSVGAEKEYKQPFKILGKKIENINGEIFLGGNVDQYGIKLTSGGIGMGIDFPKMELWKDNISIIFLAFPPQGTAIYNGLKAVPGASKVLETIGKVSLNFKFSIEGEGEITSAGESLAVIIAIKAKPDLELELSLIKGAVKGWMGIGLTGELDLSIPLAGCLKATGRGYMGYSANLLLFAIEEEFKVETSPLTLGTCPTIRATEVSFTTIPIRSTPWHFAGGNYKDDYNQFLPGGNRSAYQEPLIIASNVYTYAHPSMAWNTDASQGMMLWTHDDLSKTPGQSYEILGAHWENDTWTAPISITNDTYPDGNPQLIYDPDDNVLAVWERYPTHDDLISATLDITRTRHFEIAYAFWNATSRGWSAPGLVTSNAVLDYKPVLAGNVDGTALLVWRQNTANLLEGTETNPDTLQFAHWDGSAWSTPATAVDTLVGLTDHHAVYSDSQAILAYTVYITNAAETSATHQIFTLAWDGSSWTSPVRRTDEATQNMSPQLFYYHPAAPGMVWLEDGRPVIAPLIGGSQYQATFETGTDSIQASVKHLAHGPVLSLSWISDGLYYAIFDFNTLTWSLPQRVMETGDQLNAHTALLTSEGILDFVFARTLVTPTTITETTTAREVVTYTIPVFGQTDLVRYQEVLTTNLSILTDTFQVSPTPLNLVTVMTNTTTGSILDYQCTQRTITIPQNYPVSDVNVGVTIQHTYRTHLDIHLTSPGGTMIELITDVGSSADHLDVLFDEDVATGPDSISHNVDPPYYDNIWNPEGNLDLLQGENSQGTWTLQVCDDTGGTTGQLDRWTLFLTPAWPADTIQELYPLTVTVANTGDFPATPLAFSLYNGDPDAGGIPILTDSIPVFPGGYTRTFTMTYAIPLTDTNQTLYAVIDPDNLVAESTEEDNRASTAFGPDLNLQSGSAIYWPGNDVDLTVYVENSGTGIAPTTTVEYYLEWITGTLLVTDTLPRLFPGERLTQTVAFNSSSLSTGSHTIIAQVNPGTFPELQTWNNQTAFLLDILADVAVSPYFFIADKLPNGSVVFTGTVFNFGEGLLQNIPVSIYANSPITAENEIYSTTLPAIPAGSYAIVSGTWVTLEDEYSLYIWANPDRLIEESRYDNNLAALLSTFRVELVNNNQTVLQGKTAIYSGTVYGLNGFARPVAISVTGLPPGVQVEADPDPLTPTDDFTLFLTPGTISPPGVYAIVIEFSDGLQTLSLPAILTIQSIDLTISKTKLGSTTTFPGDEFEYRLYYQVTGDADARNVVITDTLPLSLTYIHSYNSVGFDVHVDGQTVTWHNPFVPEDSSGYLYLVVALDKTATPGTPLINVARIGTSMTESAYSNNAYTHTINISAKTWDLGLSLIKSSGNVVAGSQFIYRTYYNNYGNSPATNVTITTTLPVSATYIGNTTTTGFVPEIHPDHIVWRKGLVNAGESGYLYYTVQVADGLPAGVTLVSTSTVSLYQPDTNHSNNQVSLSLNTLAPTTDISIDEWLDLGNPTPGNQMTYELNYRNYGNAPATNVVLTNTLPDGVELVSYSTTFSPTQQNRQIIWGLGSIPGSGYAGDRGSLFVTVRVPETMTIGTVLTNSTAITTDKPDSNASNQADQTIQTVRTGVSDMRINKYLSNTTLAQGSEAMFRLYYYNNNNDAATGIVLTDTLPLNMTYLRTDGPYQPVVNGQQLVWSLPPMVGRQFEDYYQNLYFYALVDPDTPVGSVLSNTAAVKAQNETLLTNNTALLSGLSVAAPTRDLGVDVSFFSGQLYPDAEVTFKIYYRNYGNAHLENTVLTTTLPAEVEYVSASGNVLPVVKGRVLVWNLGTIPGATAAGYADSFYVTVHILPGVKPGTTMRTQLQGFTSSHETGSQINQDTLQSQIGVPTYDISPFITLNTGSPLPGQIQSLKARISNTGNQIVKPVYFTITLPVSTTFLYWSGDTGMVLQSIHDRELIFKRDEVAANTSTSYLYLYYIYDLNLPSDIALVATAECYTPQEEVNTTNNLSVYEQRSQTQGRDLKLNKTWTSGTPISGSSLAYQLTYQNLGDQKAYGVQIVDQLPVGLSYLSTSASGWTTQVNGQVITYTRGDLAANTSGSISLNVLVTSTLTTSTWLTNRATISALTSDANPENNTSLFALEFITNTRDLYIDLYKHSGAAIPGGEFTYGLRYRNYGNLAARDVAITLTLDPRVQYKSTSSLNSPIIAENQLTFTLDAVPGLSGYQYIYVTVQVDADVQIGTLLHAIATITTPDPETGFNQNQDSYDQAVEILIQNVRVDISFNGAINPGNIFQYYVYAYNDGQFTVSDIWITDTITGPVDILSFSPGVSLTQAGNTTYWYIDELPQGSTYFYYDVYIHPDAPVGSEIINTARVSPLDWESNVYDNEDIDVRTVITGVADMRIQKYINTALVAGEEVTYQIFYYNYNNVAAAPVIITDTLPDTLQYVSAHGDYLPVVNGNTLVWSIPAVSQKNKPMDRGNLYITALVTDTVSVGTTIANTVNVWTRYETNTTNNQAVRSANVVAATRDLFISCNIESGYPVPGEVLTYSIAYVNFGNASTDHTILTSTLPVSTTLLNTWGDFTPTLTNGSLEWDLGTVPANSPYSYAHFSVRLDQDIPVGTQLRQEARISTSDPETGGSQNEHYSVITTQAREIAANVFKDLWSGTFAPDQVVTYWVYYYSNSNVPISNVKITDTLPVGMSYDPTWADLDTAGWTRTISGNQVTWEKPWVTPSESASLYLSARIGPDIPPGTALANQVWLGFDQDDENLGWDYDVETRKVLAEGVDLSVHKELAYGHPVPGQFYHYAIDFINQGTQTASDILMTDTLPANLTYQFIYYESGYLGSPSLVDDQLIWYDPSLASGESGRVIVVTMVNGPLASPTIITNSVEICTSGVDVDLLNNTSILTSTLYPFSAELELDKFPVTGSPYPGGEITFIISYANRADGPAEGTTITDTIPAELTFVSTTAPFSSTIVDDQLIFDAGTIPPFGETGYSGNFAITFQIKPTVTIGTEICNQAGIKTNSYELSTNDNWDNACILVVNLASDLYIEKSTWSNPIPDNLFTYSLYFKNYGNDKASNVTVRDLLPAGMTMVDWSGYLYAPGYVNLETLIAEQVNGQEITWEIGEMPQDTWGFIYLTVQVSSTLEVGAQLTNTSWISTTSIENLFWTNQSSVVNTIETPSVDIYVSKSLSGNQQPPGGLMKYQIYFEGYGNASAPGLTITDVLPAELTYHHWEGYFYPRGGIWTKISPSAFSQNGQVLRWEPGELMQNGWGHIDLWVTITETLNGGEQLINQVFASSRHPDPYEPNNTYTSYDHVAERTYDLYVRKMQESNTEPIDTGLGAAPGGQKRYYVYFWNLGNSTATGVVLTDTLPVSTTFVKYTGYTWNPSDPHSNQMEGTITPTITAHGEVVWEIGDVEPGGWGYLYPQIYLDPAIPVGSKLTNTVSIAGDQVDLNPGNNHYVHVIEVIEPYADMRIVKTLDNGPYEDGLASYEIYFKNRGNVPARDVILTDTLPLSTTLWDWNGYLVGENFVDLDNSITPSISGNTITWELNELDQYHQGYIYLTLRLDETIQPGTWLENHVAISNSVPEYAPGDNASIAGGFVNGVSVDIFPYKYTPEGNFVPGGIVTYTINVYNFEASFSHNISVTDTLPQEVEVIAITGTQGILQDGLQLTWQIAELAPGSSDQTTVVVQIPLTLPIGTKITNTIEVYSADDGYTGNNAHNHVRSLKPPFIKEHDILLVLDRGPNNIFWYERFFADSLNELGVGYDTWWVDHYGSIPDDLLSSYQDGIVIWSLPDWGLLTEDNHVVALLEAYLNHGGRLFITGQDIGYYSRYIGYAPFYTNHLFAQYIQDDTNILNVVGAPGDPIGDGLSLALSGADSANNQVWPDEIDPLGSAVPVFYYPVSRGSAVEQPIFDSQVTRVSLPGHIGGSGPGITQPANPAGEGSREAPIILGSSGLRGVLSSGTAGLRVDTGTYRLVYFAFGFEAIDGQANRVVVMDRVLKWLAGESQAPTLISPAEQSELTAGKVTLQWEAAPGGVEYHLQVNSSPNFNERALMDIVVPGTSYTITLQAGDWYWHVRCKDALGRWSDWSATWMFTADIPKLVASFMADPASPIAGQTILFTSTSTTDGEPLSAWVWDFGDGSPGATGEVVQHVYSTAGIFQVTLIISDTGGYSSTTQEPVNVALPDLVAAFDLSTSTLIQGATAYFTDTSHTNGPLITRTAWDFGAGPVHQNEASIHHAFLVVGSWPVTLVITDALGFSDSVSQMITVLPPSIQADFTQDWALTVPGEILHFTDTSTTNGPAITTYIWDFGDGTPVSTSQPAPHAYASPGTYQVSLTVIDLFGNQQQVSKPGAVQVVPGAAGWVYPGSTGSLDYDPDPGVSITVTFPSGAVDQPLRILLLEAEQDHDNLSFSFGDLAFDLEAYRGGLHLPGHLFDQSFLLTIDYTDAMVAGIDEQALLLMVWDAGSSTWLDAASTCTPTSVYQRDPDQNRLSLNICHLSHFGMFGPASGYRIYLPLVMRNTSARSVMEPAPH